MASRIRIGKRGQEHPAAILGVARVSGHECTVAVHLSPAIPGATPDVYVAFGNDHTTALLARRLVAALEAEGIDWRTE